MKRSEGRFLTITGPNMGGKSTYIRQIAISALLCQIGMFVPAKRAVMPVFDSIMARVGASDAQLKGISTFMAEMLESSTIVKSASKNSLVIVDELGRGTSTEDGYGIAYALAKHLCNDIKCFTLFATHFHELGDLEEELDPLVKNKHAQAVVDEKNDKLTFLYSMKNGVAEMSYGVHVAKVAQFPSATIESAQRVANHLEAHANKNKKVVVTNREKALFSEFGVDSAVNLAKMLVKDGDGGISEELFLQKAVNCLSRVEADGDVVMGA